MQKTNFQVIFILNGNELSPVYTNRDIMEFKDYDGVLYAFDDLDEGFIYYEELVNKINNDIDWMSIRP
jgi:hypothetical protein